MTSAPPLSSADFYTLRATIAEAIRIVEDPELFVSIVDLGLLYNITLDDKQEIVISLTLTTIGCPLFETIEKQVREEVQKVVPEGTAFSIDIVFDPPWSLEMVAPDARAELGIV